MQKPEMIYLANTAAGPKAGTLIVKIQDLPAHGGKDILYKAGDKQTNIFVQKIGEGFHVFENWCPHAGTPLNLVGERFLNLVGTHLICRTHGALFDKTSGLCVGGPCKGDYLKPIAFEVRDGGIYSR